MRPVQEMTSHLGTRVARFVAAFLFAVLSTGALAQALAPGFTTLPADAKIALMPSDIELYSIAAGGVVEPRADWTEAANRNFKAALLRRAGRLGLTIVEVPEDKLDELSELTALQDAVARAIELHHFGLLHLPTKDGKLDWSLGDAAQLIRKATGADYALFTWVRDGYASGEMQATMAAVAILTLGRTLVIGGGRQNAYASLIELDTGRVVWFNRLQRVAGDLRDGRNARETVSTLLTEFPPAAGAKPVAEEAQPRPGGGGRHRRQRGDE